MMKTRSEIIDDLLLHEADFSMTEDNQVAVRQKYPEMTPIDLGWISGDERVAEIVLNFDGEELSKIEISCYP